MRINYHSVFTKLLSIMGYITFPIWLFFTFIYIPDSCRLDFVENKDEFYSIMAFVQEFLFYILHLILTAIFSLFGIRNKRYMINSKYKIINLIICLGIILNFIPIILFSIFIIYLIFFFT